MEEMEYQVAVAFSAAAAGEQKERLICCGQTRTQSLNAFLPNTHAHTHTHTHTHAHTQTVS